MSSIEERLAAIENDLSAIKRVISKMEPPKSEEVAPTVKANPQAVSYDYKSPIPPAKEISTSNYLGMIGIACFLFAALYVIKLAIDTGWLTPIRQVLFASSFGGLLIGAGFILRERDQEYASYLPAAGLTILYMSLFGATVYHDLLEPSSAVMGCLVLGAGALLLYDEFKNSIYQLIACVGTYITPLAFAAGGQAAFGNSYYLIASVVFTAMSVFMDQRSISLMAAYMAILISSLYEASGNPAETRALLTAGHFLIFSAGVVLHSVRRRSGMEKSEANSFFPLIIFFYVIEFILVKEFNPQLAPYMSFGLSALLIGMYHASKKMLRTTQSLASGNVAYAAAFLMLAHSLFFEILPDQATPIFLLFVIGAYKWVSEKIPDDWRLLAGSMQMTLIGLFIWNTGMIIAGQIFKSNESYHVTYGIIYAVFLIYASTQYKKRNEENSYAANMLFVSHGIAIISLYNLVKDKGSFAVSVAWALYAIAILAYGYSERDRDFAKSSVFVLSFCALKVLIYDTSDSPVMVRVITLLLTGAVLYGSGYVFKKIESWK